jgi:hypothetical protein
MAEFIEFTPKGLVVHKWDKKKKKSVAKRAKKLNIITHLRDRCEIAEGTTLKQIFETVDKYKFLKLVISQYSWCHHLEDFHAQAQEPQRRDDDTEKIDFLEIYHHPEVHKFVENKKHPGGVRERTVTVDFDTDVGFHGIGPIPEGKEEEYGNTKTIGYSVSYSPMWELADLPVKLNKQFDVYEPFVLGQHKRDNPPKKLLTATREFTLLEVLDAIYWDISFMGGPADNADFLEDISEKVEQIKNGEIPLIPMDKVIDLPQQEGEEPPIKVLMHPDVARFLGVDPDKIPLDDKEIIRPDEIS